MAKKKRVDMAKKELAEAEQKCAAAKHDYLCTVEVCQNAETFLAQAEEDVANCLEYIGFLPNDSYADAANWLEYIGFLPKDSCEADELSHLNRILSEATEEHTNAQDENLTAFLVWYDAKKAVKQARLRLRMVRRC